MADLYSGYTPQTSYQNYSGMGTPGIDTGALAQLQALTQQTPQLRGQYIPFQARPINFINEARGYESSPAQNAMQTEQVRGAQLQNQRGQSMYESEMRPPMPQVTHVANAMNGYYGYNPWEMNSYQKQQYMPNGSSEIGQPGPSRASLDPAADYKQAIMAGMGAKLQGAQQTNYAAEQSDRYSAEEMRRKLLASILGAR